MTDTNLNHWSMYWQTGARHSLPQDFGSNYDRELAEFWATYFISLESGASMLDVCTGTGAIPMLARDLMRAQDLQISAIDGADVDPALVGAVWSDQPEHVATIKFIFNCPVELMSDRFGAARFDLVTSQYGLEYCDLNKAAAQVASVLKNRGHLVMVTHATTSEMAKTMGAEHSEYQLLEEVGYLKLLRSWSKNQLSAQKLKEGLGRVVEKLWPHQRKSDSLLLSQVIQSMQVAMNQPLGNLLAQGVYAQQYLEQLQAAQARLEDMQRVTQLIGEGADEHWLAPFSANGLKLVSRTDIRIDGAHLAGLGWVLQKEH